MGCLIELILRRSEQQFPSHKIIRSEIISTRDSHPVYGGYGIYPIFHDYGPTRTSATLELSQLTYEEFAFINKSIDTEKVIGPIMIRNNQVDSVYVVYGLIRSGTGNRNGTATIEMDVTNINFLQKARVVN